MKSLSSTCLNCFRLGEDKAWGILRGRCRKEHESYWRLVRDIKT